MKEKKYPIKFVQISIWSFQTCLYVKQTNELFVMTESEEENTHTKNTRNTRPVENKIPSLFFSPLKTPSFFRCACGEYVKNYTSDCVELLMMTTKILKNEKVCVFL
jgi:hypothetical protein